MYKHSLLQILPRCMRKKAGSRAVARPESVNIWHQQRRYTSPGFMPSCIVSIGALLPLQPMHQLYTAFCDGSSNNSQTWLHPTATCTLGRRTSLCPRA